MNQPGYAAPHRPACDYFPSAVFHSSRRRSTNRLGRNGSSLSPARIREVARRLIHFTAIVGARPNFVKMAPILEEAGRRCAFQRRLIHTGQHYSPEMSASFFDELGMPAPDVNLEIGSGSHTAQTAGVMLRLETELNERRPDLVLVAGDVNSTMAARWSHRSSAFRWPTSRRDSEASTAACRRKPTVWSPTYSPTTCLPASRAA